MSHGASVASARYTVGIVQVDRSGWADAVGAALYSELRSIGVHRSVDLVIRGGSPDDQPAVVVFLGSSAARTHPTAVDAVKLALARVQVVVPVVDNLATYRDQVPDDLWAINGYRWDGPKAATRLARLLLEELGIEEQQRSVFISHKREDGLLAAEQLYDHLSKNGFEPFIDRFDIRIGADVQATIADALEARAFIVLLETPLAHTSEWVYDEVDYALSHTMGIHIVTWPGNPQAIPGSARLPRQFLTTADLMTSKGFDVLTDTALDLVAGEIEAAHAVALVRRRNTLLRSVEEAARSKGLVCLPLPGWKLSVQTKAQKELVGVCARLPQVTDLSLLDSGRRSTSPVADSGLLVHAARTLRDDRRDLLIWATADRPLELLPENAIGGRW